MRVLLAHGDLAAGGGAEAYARALVAGLKRAGHEVGILDIWGHRPPDGPAHRPALLTLGTGLLTRRFSLWKYALVCRTLPGIAMGYDRVVLSYGEGPALPRPTIRLLHAPVLFSGRPAPLGFLGAATSGQRLRVRQFYAKICRMIARPDLSVSEKTTTLANSRWTARMARKFANVRGAHVLYPEVKRPAKPAHPPEREPHRFLALGRIVPNKRLEEAVALVERLRAEGYPAVLQILGRADTRYAKRLLAGLKDHPAVILSPDADPDELSDALAKATYGIHAYRNEHFGIAVGEMIAAGVLPLVYDGGGVGELVPIRALRFKDPHEALDRAKALIGGPAHGRDTLIARLQATRAFRAATTFDANVDAALARHLGGA